MSKKEHQFSFGAVFVMIVVVSFIIAMIGTLDTSPITGSAAAVQTISRLEADNNHYMEIRNVEGLSAMDMHIKDTIKDAKIYIDEIPKTSWFTGTAYSTFEITSPDAPKIGTTIYTIKLNKEKIKELRLKEVSLYLEGQELTTTKIKETDRYIYYTAETEGLGQFVIGAASTAEDDALTETTLEEAIINGIKEEAAKKAKALIGKSVEEPTKEKKDLFSKVINFFQKLFD